MEERGLRSNEKVNGQLDYQTRKMVSPQSEVNIKKENSNPLDQNGSIYSLKGYERQVGYSSNQYDQNRQGGEQSKIISNNNPYLKQSLYNNTEQGKPFIRTYQEGDQRKPLDQVNYKQDLRQMNEREIASPYMNLENQKRDLIGSRTPLDPRSNLNGQTPQTRQDNYCRDIQQQQQQSENKREFQLPEYRRMYPEQDLRNTSKQISSYDKPIDLQVDRLRYDQDRIRTVGGQQEQPERFDRMIRASDYVRKSDYHDLQEQHNKVLDKREFGQRSAIEQNLLDQRNNTSKSQEYSQRQQNQIKRPQEGSKTPIEGRMIERRGFDDLIQQHPRFNQQFYPQNPYVEPKTQQQQQQQYDVKPPIDDHRRIPIPYEERRNMNPYETRQQFQDQRTPFDRRPDRVEFEKRPDRVEYERRPERVEFERRPDRVEFEKRPDRSEFEKRPDRVEYDRRPERVEFEKRLDRPEIPDRRDFEGRSPYQARFGPVPEGRFDVDQRLHPDNRQYYQGYNNERLPQQGFRQGQEGKYQYEGRLGQRNQLEERGGYGQDRFQDVRQGMNQRKFSDGRNIQDGRVENREGLDGRGGFNRTFGDERYQGNTMIEGRQGFDGRREQFGSRPPIQSRPYEERGNLEQRIPIENKNQYQRGYDDKFGDRQIEQKYSQMQDGMSKKDFGRSDYTKMREELDKRNAIGRTEMDDKMSEFGKRKEVEGRIRPETSYGKSNGFGQQLGERYYRRELNDQGQRLSYHEDTSLIDRLGLERGTNRNIIGNQAAENMLRGQSNNRPYERERSFNRFGMGERVASFTNSKMGYQRTAIQDKEEYQGYVRSKIIPKSSLGNGPTEFQRKQSQDQGFSKLQSPKAQVETRVGIYDIQRRDGRI
ncbi:unnamed protein product [Paramecium sonneborni]|uniref:Uncharacterized protein n=1 Tax=Paramecium sonneborni TaxID=65129 RepID=A0A8S1QSS2_9CILI|nr:unnamed protein product [Paramecium sonneborni]